MIWVSVDRSQGALYLRLARSKIIAKTDPITDNASIDLTVDGEPIGITIFEYYTNRRWTLTEDVIRNHRLSSWLDDFLTVKKAWFDGVKPQLAQRVTR